MDNTINISVDNSYQDRHYCWRCGKPVDDLPTLGDIDPEADDKHKEQKLFRIHRELKPPPYDSELEEILTIISESWDEDFEAIKEFYGPDKVKKAYDYDEECGHFIEAWECLNCIGIPGYWRQYIWRK